jgi:hypothetical protein
MLRSLLLVSLLLLSLVTVPPAAAQGTFEGAVSLNVTGDDGKSMPMNYLTKGGKIRFDMSAGPGQEGAMLIDPTAQKMLMIMDTQRMYMEMDLTQPAPGRQDGAATQRPPVRTGKIETIAGYRCEHIIVTDDDGTSTDACVSSELGSFRMFVGGGPMSPPREAGWSTRLGANAFPLKVQKGEKVILEVTKVEPKSLDAALVAAPQGYQKFSRPGMRGRPPR